MSKIYQDCTLHRKRDFFIRILLLLLHYQHIDIILQLEAKFQLTLY